MIFWISWYQPTDDHRPLTFPPNKSILGWWCTGYSDNAAVLCALVVANSPDDAMFNVRLDWPEAVDWRFCDEKQSTELSDRFPIGDWDRKRIDAYNRGEYED